MADRTHDGRALKILTIVEEYSRECLAIVVARGLRSIDVLKTLAALFVTHGVPAHIRSACYEQVVKALDAVGSSNRGLTVRLTLRAAQFRDAHSTIPLPSASLSA